MLTDRAMDPSTHHRNRKQLYKTLCEWGKSEMQLSFCFVASHQLLSCISPIALLHLDKRFFMVLIISRL